MGEFGGRKVLEIPTDDQRLVLGFDAECATCTDMARRVRRAAGGRLFIRSLNDPQLRVWRQQALGADAPWAPTLFEVGGGVVRAWTGVKMGWILNRRLGPAATWRIMKALGDTDAASRLASTFPGPAVSRGQFLKAAGGAAVTMSLLSGGAVFPSAAFANTSGTEEQRTRAKRLVRGTSQYQSLANLQAQIGSTFDVETTSSARASSSTDPGPKIHVSADGSRAQVITVAPHDSTRAILAEFQMNLNQGSMIRYETLVYCPIVGKDELKVTYFHQGRIPARNHKTRFGDNYVATYDNRLISYEQWEREAEAASSRTVTSRDTYGECVARAEAACGTQMTRVCTAIGVGGVALGFASAGAGAAIGLGAAASCLIVSEYGCPGIGTSYCKEKYGSAAVIGKPPSYYC